MTDIAVKVTRVPAANHDTALSPWPANVSEGRNQTARLAEAIGRPDTTGFDIVTRRLGAATSAVIERFAPNAPQVLRDEAVIRFAGYLLGSETREFGVIRSDSVGPLSSSYITDHAAAFRRSGAQGLLAPWRVLGAYECDA